MPNSAHIPTPVVAETRYPLTPQQATTPFQPVCALLQWQEKRMQELATLRKNLNH